MKGYPIPDTTFLFSDKDIELIIKLMGDAEAILNEFDKEILALIKKDPKYVVAIIDLVGNYLVHVEAGGFAHFFQIAMQRRLDLELGIEAPAIEVELPKVQLTQEQKKRMN